MKLICLYSLSRFLHRGKNTINDGACERWCAPHIHSDGVLILSTMLKLPLCLPAPNTHVTAPIQAKDCADSPDSSPPVSRLYEALKGEQDHRDKAKRGRKCVHVCVLCIAVSQADKKRSILVIKASEKVKKQANKQHFKLLSKAFRLLF